LSGLGSGASCSLVEGSDVLMVSNLDDAVVNDGGAVLHLQPEAKDWRDLSRGGRFSSERLIVEVQAGLESAREDEVIQRDVSMKVTRGRMSFAISHGPTWACGS
jgi:hypothetical protein